MNRHMDEARDFISRMNLLLTALLVVICLAGPRLARAEKPVQIGSMVADMGIGVCISKETAMKVADSLKEGQEKADQTFDEMACKNIRLQNFTVGNVVYVTSFGDGRFLKVVEITLFDGAKLYWLTFKQIVKYKVDNNT